MYPLAIDDGRIGFQIDLCRTCQALWFDASESERFPARTGGEVAAFLPNGFSPLPKDRDSLHRARVEAIRAAEETGLPEQTTPDSLPAAVLSYLGFPVEDDPPPRADRPWMTWLLLALCGFVFLLQISGEDHGFFENLAYFPKSGIFSPGVFTSFFVHAGWFHLLANLWFLHLLGDNIEGKLGPLRFLLLVMAATAVGSLVHGVFEPASHVPVVGASAGISGLLVYYALCWPTSRLLVGFRIWILPFWVRIGAGWALVYWLIFQFLGGFLQLAGMADISYLGHLGGAVVGLLAFLLPNVRSQFREPRAGDFTDPAAVARYRRK